MVAANDTPPPFQVVKKHRRARNYFKRLTPNAQERIKEAIKKICQNPLIDHKPFAIKRLEGRLRDLIEYRMPNFARIIYRVVDDPQGHMEIHDILPHLS